MLASIMVELLFLQKIKNKLKTIEAQIGQKFKNNKPRPKFSGSYKKACISSSLDVTERVKPGQSSCFV